MMCWLFDYVSNASLTTQSLYIWERMSLCITNIKGGG